MLYSRPEAVLTAVLLAAGLLPMNANAYVSFSKNGEELINTLHTHIYSPTLSLPSSKEIKVAKVCFITDVSDCSGNEFANSDDMENNGSPDGGGNPDYDLDDAERCKKEGYTLTSCAEGETPEGFCIYDNNYFKKCACPSGYKTCEPPYYGVGQACGNKYASCEKDTERACKELNPDYTNTCESGWQINPNDKCKYDETFGTCCNQCAGYDYTTIPEGYVQDGEACTDCNGQTKYKVKINPCDGFLDCGSMGPAAGANSCLSGTVTKYDNCKPCPNLGTLTSCPSPYTCTYEECSNRYYKSGCQSGYDWNASSQTCTAQCANKGTLTSCPSPFTCTYESCSGKYYKTGCQSGYDWNASSQTCTAQCANKGTLTSCPSPFTCTYEACSGKYYKTGCQSGYDWNTSSQTCTAQCSSDYQYTCTGSNETGGSGTACGGMYTSCDCSKGYFWNGYSCREGNACMKGSQLGYILNSDMTVTSSKQSGKTPIGVVVCSYAGGGGQAMALNSIGYYEWGGVRIDIPSLTNYRNEWDAFLDIASCGNTAKIRMQGDSSAYPAAWAAYDYSTEGTNVGDWCLPAAGIFTSEYLGGISSAFRNVGGTPVSRITSYNSSTELNDMYTYGPCIANAYFVCKYASKRDAANVQPVIGFCKSGYKYDKNTDSCK